MLRIQPKSYHASRHPIIISSHHKHSHYFVVSQFSHTIIYNFFIKILVNLDHMPIYI
ncbi:hypothetical protein Leryth_000855 [Lithospermum erythrorhizon]|nr:hypothetical protein Leryth_000855 [Lithospermum erythrorhizon]